MSEKARKMPVEQTSWVFGFNCSKANPFLCQSSAPKMRRYNGTCFYPLIEKNCIFLLIEHKFPTCSLKSLKDKCTRAVLCQTLSHFFLLVSNVRARLPPGNIPVILWREMWFSCSWVTGEALINPVKSDLYPPMKDTA